MRPSLSPAVLFASFLSGSFLSGCIAGGGESEWQFDGVTAVDLYLSSGEIRVRSSTDEGTHIAWEGGGVGKVWPDVRQDGGRVIFDGDDMIGGGEVRADVTGGVPLTIRLDSGEIDVVLDAPASVDACVAAGEVSITLPAGGYRLDLAMGAGAMSTDDIWDDADSPYTLTVCAGAGDVRVQAGEG